ncbi:MAG TPA: MBL fold metallo-hydrolase [Gemmatimonadaceae bacterium]|nr:MBL fold metallo-hydrolase [Gemmatimonadaceae bacterium]
MKLWMLGSGSRGNAILVECDGSRILIDCGYGTRTLTGRLKTIGVKPDSIDACLVTHEHSDHVHGAKSAMKRWGWEMYATPATARAAKLSGSHLNRFAAGTTLHFPTMTVSTTPTPHDARESVGFVVTSKSTGARAGLFYDFGYVTRAIARACASLDILVLESNHDADMLRDGPYPAFLQARIASRVGHLSNLAAAAFAREAVTRETNHLVLAHLSEKCNTPRVALTNMRTALAKSRFRGTLTAAKQDAVVGPFTPGTARAEKPVQYTLFA